VLGRFGLHSKSGFNLSLWDWNWRFEPYCFSSLLGFGVCDLGFLLPLQRPWSKIIHENQVTAILLCAFSLYPREICHRSKLKSGA
jgi:hypothetical protein